MKTRYSVIGAMCGSSMDGMDLVNVEFSSVNGKWEYSIKKSSTIPYNQHLIVKLKSLANQDQLDIEMGQWISKEILHFLDGSKVHLLAVHGHTAIHDPMNGISWQLGDGQIIANITNIKTATEFRSLDISIGGQGAPLVPFGDFTLFREFDACLNLGGIANVSLRDSKIAWDICPCNQVLNYYAEKLGHQFDFDGHMARQGSINKDFIESIGANNFFYKKPPKSLSNKFISEKILDSINPVDGLRSYIHFISHQIKQDLSSIKASKPKMLVTGGGALNGFLMEEIRSSLIGWDVIRPTQQLIQFKEALIFAFLGLLRLKNKINVLSSVTGGAKDTSSGVIHIPK